MKDYDSVPILRSSLPSSRPSCMLRATSGRKCWYAYFVELASVTSSLNTTLADFLLRLPLCDITSSCSVARSVRMSSCMAQACDHGSCHEFPKPPSNLGPVPLQPLISFQET
ncbi:hypothetical protein VFPPC_16951 [Pochonia chlamydosporia 170]|uniref:Uncharacterized protein n=1 Tax=Pochonia chlamydosporia 170 TaxID=1380566 RepID=A0A179F011_METCM|nr:hypothetical protein VFPPC_16951 [Pochonia chlamydosporia 170]OAQ58748.1 hypothetical protein VFPPC_16951 [Pochonia chlamydosporia 170]